jgi:hypothetical protein
MRRPGVVVHPSPRRRSGLETARCGLSVLTFIRRVQILHKYHCAKYHTRHPEAPDFPSHNLDTGSHLQVLDSEIFPQGAALQRVPKACAIQKRKRYLLNNGFCTGGLANEAAVAERVLRTKGEPTTFGEPICAGVTVEGGIQRHSAKLGTL